MARTHEIAVFCDSHQAFLDDDSYPATQEKYIPFGEVRRVDLCDHCAEMPFWHQLEELLPWLLKIYAFGAPVEEPKSSRGGRQAIREMPQSDTLPDPEAEDEEAGDEIRATSEPTEENEPDPAPKPVEKKAAPRKPVKKKKPEAKAPIESEAEKSIQFVVCPLDHPLRGGGPVEVGYPHRGGHATQVHNCGPWDIKWGDPNGILTAPCTSHKECLATHMAFTSQNGLTFHINKSLLARIDV